MARNKAKFDGQVSTHLQITRNCISFLHKLILYQRFTYICSPPLVERSNSHRVSTVYWSPPTYPYIKINTDGSFAPFGAGVGGVFRKHFGQCILYFQASVCVVDALEAELTAVYWAITLPKMNHWHNLIIKGYSEVLLQMLQDRRQDSWCHAQWANKIMCMLSTLKARLAFIYREGKQPANWLARNGLYIVESLVSYTPPLSFFCWLEML
ncbi:uncharacterized protein LOC110038892 [Phalaenopsis equestris]|uniref:uncharacterized protein LOC110038892 n=1 Tax=Phalaenopsis equestris TaxID=78828 RepID=UPI0009E63C13|nr:uncharacterized protein LOC110038892 [Phalaenopsis equestris]